MHAGRENFHSHVVHVATLAGTGLCCTYRTRGRSVSAVCMQQLLQLAVVYIQTSLGLSLREPCCQELQQPHEPSILAATQTNTCLHSSGMPAYIHFLHAIPTSSHMFACAHCHDTASRQENSSMCSWAATTTACTAPGLMLSSLPAQGIKPAFHTSCCQSCLHAAPSQPPRPLTQQTCWDPPQSCVCLRLPRCWPLHPSATCCAQAACSHAARGAAAARSVARAPAWPKPAQRHCHWEQAHAFSNGVLQQVPSGCIQ